MKSHQIMADSFVLKHRRLRIYRVSQTNSATLLWFLRDDAVNYLKQIQVEKLQARQGR